VTSPFFGTSLRRGPTQPPTLAARIEAEICSRIEEAVDFVCLDAMVQARRAQGGPAPATDNPADRAEYDREVAAFFGRLEHDLLDTLSPDRRPAVTAAGARSPTPRARSLAVLVALAKELPEYWLRFDEVRERYRAERQGGVGDSGSERRGLLGRLFGL
jgi:hypothetical protein